MQPGQSQTPSSTELRQFGLIFGGFIALIFGLVLPFLFSAEYRLWPWIVAGVFCLWALIHAPSLLPVFRIWIKFGNVLNFINTRLILGLVFYCLFFPMGALMRLAGWDAMHRKFMDKTESYRIQSKALEPGHIRHPF